MALDVLNGLRMRGILTPEQAASFAAESAKIVEAEKSAAVVPDPKAGAVPDKVADPKAGEAVSGAEGSADKGETPPVKPDALDLSFLPESVRSKVHVDDDHALAALKSGYMAHGAATKKFQEAAALKDAADKWNFIVGDPDLADLVVKAIADKKAGRKPVLPADEPDPEIDPLDPKSVASVIDRRVKAGVEEGVGRLREELDAPARYHAEMNAALGAYAEQHAIEPDVMVEAIKLAAADLSKSGETAEPRDVPRLMGAYVRLARVAKPTTTPVNKPVTPNGHAGTEAVTSPTARGGPHTGGVVPFPSHWKNGECPLHETDEQMESSHLYRMRRLYGPNVTLEDVRAGVASR